MVPADTYRLLSYQTYRNDDQGDRWRLNAQGTNLSPFVKVDGNSKPVISLGEPFTPVVTTPPVQFAAEMKNHEYLQFNIVGAGEGIVNDINHISGNNSEIPRSRKTGNTNYPKEPAFRIVTSEGEVVHSGSFEYG